MSVYIAASLPLLSFAKILAEGLSEEGIDVVSTWHEGEPTIEKERTMSAAEAHDLAWGCFCEIDNADALVLLYDGGDRKGSFVETGYALGRDKRVLAVRTGAFPLPTVLLRHPDVTHAEGSLQGLGADGVADCLREMAP